MSGSTTGRVVTACAYVLPVIAFLVAVVLPDHRGDGSYYASGRLLLQDRVGPERYDDDWMRNEVEAATAERVSDIFTPNPPTAALIAVAVAWLPPSSARRAWDAINVTVLLLSLVCLVRGCRLPVDRVVGHTERLRLEAPWLIAVVFSLFAAPVIEGILLGQAYILLLGLQTLAWWGLQRRDRQAVVGAGLALGLMLKASGAPLWLLLGARGARTALGWGMAWCVLIGSMTLPWFGVGMWSRYLVDVLPAAVGTPAVSVTAYQSLPGFWSHLFRFDAQWNPAPLADAPAVAAILTVASVVAVVALTLAVTRRAPLSLAFGAMASASIFVLPLAEQHHYTLAVLPAFVAAGEWARRAPAHARTVSSGMTCLALVVAGLLLALPLPYEAARLSRGAMALLAYPRLCGGLLLWGVLLWFSGLRQPAVSDVAHVPRSNVA